MVCSAPVAPTVTMVGGPNSPPQICARNFLAIFLLIVMSWCAVLGDCGQFSWLRSEPCFCQPHRTGWELVHLLQPQKILIQTMSQQSKKPSSTKLPAPTMLLPYSSYNDLLYSPPHASSASKCSCKLICGIKTMDTHNNAVMKVSKPLLMLMMVAEAAVVKCKGLGDISNCGHLQTDGDGVLWRWQIQQRFVTIGEAFVELEKYVDTSDHNTDLPNRLHLVGSLPQTAGWIDWLRLMRLLHDMMVCTSVVVMCLQCGV